jgi:hypothetical protein
MLILDELRRMLRSILAEPHLDTAQIKRFQQLVWDEAEAIQGASETQEQTVRDLAYDLDWYEPADRIRAEAPGFFGEDRARREIQQALAAIQESELA